MKRRVEILEEKIQGTEPLVIYRSTFYEDKNGNTTREDNRASLVWGAGKHANTERMQGETRAEFRERVEGYAKLTWEQARRVLPLPDSKIEQSRMRDRAHG